MGAFYSNAVGRFINDDDELIIGALTIKAGLAGFHQQLHTQTLSWKEEISILKAAFVNAISQNPAIEDFAILLEYPIARREKRIDVVIIASDLIIVVEFKVGQIDYLSLDKEQLMDYCLDLRDFHFESRNRNIVPILLATNAKDEENEPLEFENSISNMQIANVLNFAGVLQHTISNCSIENAIDYLKWNVSDYNPTPTIIEAAKTLYSGKSVVEISRSHARIKNLTRTSDAVIEAINAAKRNNEKIICFITGVPGAGKTLAGLNIAHHKAFQNKDGSIATFLSGNGPLVKVLKEALSRDAYKRAKLKDPKATKKSTGREISFIENVHNFISHYFEKADTVPNNRIVIFDEAQRAWNAEQSKRKFQRNFSEAEIMLEIMSRDTGWAAIVALVGGGQEINTGEAGLPEWGKVLKEKFNKWKVYISPQLKKGNHSTGDMTLFDQVPSNLEVIEEVDLHLDVSIRSYKAEQLSNWVNLVLTNEPFLAKELHDVALKNYKILLTRDLEQAKKWLRNQCKGSRRMGLVASSGARRLRPYGLDVKVPLEESEWFLNDRNDVRSSYYLETPATEFGVQGLELDWTGVCWDADLRRKGKSWDFNSFSGTRWTKTKASAAQTFTLNKYRVLLTRAREGMIIFVPPGDFEDPTRNPEWYDQIADYLISCGVRRL
ncbi:DUF2075 domain-containing protein [Mucilaginibacter sp. HD30]